MPPKTRGLGLFPMEPLPHPGISPRLDVVLVPGFGMHSTDQWRSLWPSKPVTPESRGDVRVLAFTYYEASTRPYREEELSKLSVRLLSQVNDHRKDSCERLRPVLFVGHSVGGIIIKKALLTAQLDSRFRNISFSTFGVIFFATPHQSSSGGGSWPDITSRIYRATPFNWLLGKQSPQASTILDQGDSNGLDLISEEFRAIQNLRLVSVIEGKHHGLDERVVPDASARLGLPGEVIRELPDRDHFEVCKFEGSLGESTLMSLIQEMETKSPKAVKGDFHDSYKTAVLSLGLSKIRPVQSAVRPAEGTCEWLQQKPQFKAWYDWKAGKNLLSIQGDMGCGKSRIARRVTELLGQPQKMDGAKPRQDTIAVCPLDEISEGYKTARSVLVCLLHDIFIARRDLVGKCLTRRVKEGSYICDWPLPKIQSLWYDVVSEATRMEGHLSLVIDGIDQLVDDQKTLAGFFKCIAALPQDPRIRSGINAAQLRVLVLCRQDERLDALNKWFQLYRIETHDIQADIAAVVGIEMELLAKRHGYNDELKRDISSRIEGSAGGMWLWARLVLNEVGKEKLTNDGLENLMLPRELAGLYDWILGRLSKAEDQRRFLQNVLFWMTHQLHPMNEEELRIGLAMAMRTGLPHTVYDPNKAIRENDVENALAGRNLRREVLVSCHPLVKILPDGRFSLIHRSLQVCLIKPPEALVFPMAHHKHYHCSEKPANKVISSLCMDYLLLAFFRDAGRRYGASDEEKANWIEKVKGRIADNAFVKYAALHWMHHAKLSGEPLHTDLAQYKTSSPQYKLLEIGSEHALSWAEVWWYLMKWPNGEPFSEADILLPKGFPEEEGQKFGEPKQEWEGMARKEVLDREEGEEAKQQGHVPTPEDTELRLQEGLNLTEQAAGKLREQPKRRWRQAMKERAELRWRDEQARQDMLDSERRQRLRRSEEEELQRLCMLREERQWMEQQKLQERLKWEAREEMKRMLLSGKMV